MSKIPTISDYITNEWDEGDGLPGPAYRRKYGVDPGGPEASGETQAEFDARVVRNERRYRAEMRRKHMKRPRIAQFVKRLTAWRTHPEIDIRNMPSITFIQEMTLEEARLHFGYVCLAPGEVVSVNIYGGGV